MKNVGDFPGGPVVKTPHFQCRDAGGLGSIPVQGTKIPHAAQSQGRGKKMKKVDHLQKEPDTITKRDIAVQQECTWMESIWRNQTAHTLTHTPKYNPMHILYLKENWETGLKSEIQS